MLGFTIILLIFITCPLDIVTLKLTCVMFLKMFFLSKLLASKGAGVLSVVLTFPRRAGL